MLIADGGGGGSMYAVQIESLEDFQKKLTAILDSLEQDQSVMTMSDGSSTFGQFPEAQDFSTAYEQTKQDLINSFNEVTQLVNTMISVVGTNAAKYKQTEQDITDKFNSILQQYGDAPLPTSGTTGTSGTTVYPQSTGTGTTYATQSSTSTTTTTTDPDTGTDSSTDTGTSTDTSTPGTTDTGNTSAGAA